MMKFIPLTEKYPDIGQTILVKLKPSDWIDINYYVVDYCKTRDEEPYFVEASGEYYATWSADQILGWMPLKELDNIPFTGKEV